MLISRTVPMMRSLEMNKWRAFTVYSLYNWLTKIWLYGFIFSYSLSVSFWTQDLALQQILSSIDLSFTTGLITRTLGPSNDFTLLNGCTGKCVRLSRLLAFECTLNHCTFISFHSLMAVFYMQRILMYSYCCSEQRKCKNAAAYWYGVGSKETVFVISNLNMLYFCRFLRNNCVVLIYDAK